MVRSLLVLARTVFTPTTSDGATKPPSMRSTTTSVPTARPSSPQRRPSTTTTARTRKSHDLLDLVEARVRLADETAFAEEVVKIAAEHPDTFARSKVQYGDDVPRPGLPRDRVLEGAPDASEGLFKVPKVLP